MGDYFKRRRDLLDILKDLHSTGIQNELDLPQIVVIGSQSVGKSSLIESMSGLTLPRDTGTCTRCPMECRLQYADTWSCKIFLRFHVDSTGTPLPHMREIPFGPTLFNTEDVERMLRRAQRAILRPDLDPSTFLDDSDLHVFGIPLTFSGNCVCVRVEGPNVPDLYFYDLPGIIANVGDGGNEADIRLVEELAKSYITKPNCIVLLTLSKHIEGLPPSVSPSDPTDTTLTGLIHSLNQAFERFREKVHETAPQFRPWSSVQSVEQALEQEMLNSAKEDDDAVGLGTTNNLHVDQVMDLAKRSRTRELPGNYPFSVKENLIVESVRQWGALAMECFEEVQEIVSRHVDRLIDGHFQKFAPGGLKEEVRLVTQQQIRECAAATIEKIEGLYKSECCPYTQNDHYFFAYRSKMLQRYKLIHQQSLGKSHLITAMRAHNPSESRGMDENQWNYLNQAITALQNFGVGSVKAEDFAKLLPEDDLSPALEIMAEVRAYFQVAYKRFGDNVPKQIDADFVRGIDSGLDLALMTMDLGTDKCLEYLQEPVAVVTERRDLTGKKERLEAAQQKLSRFYDEQGL
ncbi:hypothetical protein FS837_001657 [Tulasnella sp. UAMH 9824]|nr:hypothetical protein FS837_001657 [Tulasnella sp. UAMH 9824]